MDAINTAAAGLNAAAARFADSARRTAESPLADLPGEIVERQAAEVAFEANAHVIRTADDMTGTLLDVLV